MKPLLLFLCSVTLMAQNLSVPATVNLTIGTGLTSTGCTPGQPCTLAVDQAVVMVRVAAPTAWPASSWCSFSGQWAEDGNFVYGCHVVGSGTFSAFRVAVDNGQTGGGTTTDTSCPLKAVFSTSVSGTVQLVAPLNATTVYICHIDWSGDAQTVARVISGTGSGCSTPVNETGPFTGAGGGMTAFAMDYSSPLPTTPGKTICLTLSASSNGGGTILYAQR